MDFKSSFRVNATLVSNEFIDTYMASANGEYIKEYLFLLRHEGEAVTVSMIADAVNHTESDVARALAYWKKAGVLEESVDKVSANGLSVDKCPAAGEMACAGGVIVENGASALNGVFTEAYAGVNSSYGYVDGPVKGNAAGTVTCVEADTPEKGPMAPKAPEPAPARKAEPRPVYSPEQISGLAGDEDFSQLLYIAQKYMNKVFTQRECEVFAYLYDGLHMTAELLEYVVEYCVQGGHTSIRYIETVAINWHESGLKTVEDAKAYASSFTRELVLEACNRTLATTHSPSFKYADKILSGWKKAGVRSLEDIRRLDEQHAERAKGKGSGNGSGSGSQDYRGGGNGRGRSTNQFQNFPQREIDYDALVLQQLTEK